MGGTTFVKQFPPGSLPRLPIPLYSLLKTRLKAQLRTLFATVIVPPPAPEKKDHGDIDFVVACPPNREGEPEVTPAQVGVVLGAVEIELRGNRMSHYAIEISQEDWSASTTQPLPSEKIYCQVDVQVCDGEKGAKGYAIFHGYGDLGIIIRAIAKSRGLSLDHHGLKIVRPSYSPLRLSSSPRAIFKFMRLSVDTWRKGFDTVEETFKFAATSRFFHPPGLCELPNKFNKPFRHRSMYQDFLLWARDKPSAGYTPGLYGGAVEDALVYFGQKEVWDAEAHEQWLNSNFTGELVAKWTGLDGGGVQAIMNDMRSSPGWKSELVGMGKEKVKDLVLQKSLGLPHRLQRRKSQT